MKNNQKYILFNLNNEKFAIPIVHVISIERLKNLIEVPRSSNFIKGITQIRGKTSAVIDLKERLDMLPVAETDDTRIIVVSIEGMQIGLIVDAASDVSEIDEKMIEPAPDILVNVKTTFLNGVAKIDNDLILVLRIEELLNVEEANELKESIKEE